MTVTIHDPPININGMSEDQLKAAFPTSYQFLVKQPGPDTCLVYASTDLQDYDAFERVLRQFSNPDFQSRREFSIWDGPVARDRLARVLASHLREVTE